MASCESWKFTTLVKKMCEFIVIAGVHACDINLICLESVIIIFVNQKLQIGEYKNMGDSLDELLL
jgi:hypothetical protein